jgi:predicted nucleotidyltransferase
MGDSLETKKLEIVSKLKPILEQTACFALIFGSTTKDQLTADSDIDIGVFFHERIQSYEHRSKLTLPLENTLNRELDIIVLNDADPIITNQILSTGELIHCADPAFFFSFKARKISEYIDFKRSREVIEKNLATKGWPAWSQKT